MTTGGAVRVGRSAAGLEREWRAAALDWLCVHVPLSDMPEAFTSLRAGGGALGGGLAAGETAHARVPCTFFACLPPAC